MKKSFSARLAAALASFGAVALSTPVADPAPAVKECRIVSLRQFILSLTFAL